MHKKFINKYSLKINDKYYNQKIKIEYSEIEFNHCIFKKNNNIIILNSTIKFNNCSFYKNINNIISSNKSNITFNNCIINNNSSIHKSLLIFQESTIEFSNTKICNNNSDYNIFLQPLFGYLIYSNLSTIYFTKNKIIKYNHSNGLWNLGIFYFTHSTIYFKNHTSIHHNISTKSILKFNFSNIFISDYSSFLNNQSKYNGILNLYNSNITIQNNSKFIHNKLNSSGVITIHGFKSNTNITHNTLFKYNSIIPIRYENRFNICGVCVYVNTFSDEINFVIKDNVKFINNQNYNGYGGAIYLGSFFKTNSTPNFLEIQDNVLFQNNKSKIANHIYSSYNLRIFPSVKLEKCTIKNINNIVLISNLKKDSIYIDDFIDTDIDKNIIIQSFQ